MVICFVALLDLGSGPAQAVTATAGQLIISEFRLRGPNGANDEFIEIHNASGAAHVVDAASGTGYGVAASDGTTRCTIPNGTVIPNRGHYLCVNSVGYSLASYPAGNGTTATGDATYTTDIPDNAGIANGGILYKPYLVEEIVSLEAARDYWRDLGAQTGADFIVTGIVDFDINDKSGYRTEEYTSPADGRTFYRQVLVESTGFVLDIDLAVFNADTGEMVLEENFRDFKEFDQRNYDEILGLFENLRALESQLVGIFVPQEQSATRYVFTE